MFGQTVAEVAGTMLRQRERAHELVQDRSRDCRRYDEPASAAFGDLVPQKVMLLHADRCIVDRWSADRGSEFPGVAAAPQMAAQGEDG
jgi:hypothetical protein